MVDRTASIQNTGTKLDEYDENKIDFELLLKRKPSTASSTRSSLSSSGSVGLVESEIWPLSLNTIFVDHYIFGDIIGSGSYAEVRECIDTRNLERCAIKIVNKDYLRRQAPKALSNQLQEIRLLRRLRHPNIIVLRECLFKGPKIYVVLEHCSFVLSELLAEQEGARLCYDFARNLFRQLIVGISYLHSIGIIHRDIKPQNLLITSGGILKIIDFGVSYIISMWSKDDTCLNYEGSPLFQAPEVVSGQVEYAGFGVDIWSAGVTLYLMLYGHYPFSDENLLGLYDRIMADAPAKNDLNDHDPPHKQVVDDLLASMLEKDPAKRCTTNQILQHPWLKLDRQHNGTIGRQSSSNCQEHRESIELTMKSPKNEQQQSRRDVYRSMTVLPYLHNHHFPHLSITKGNDDRNKRSPALDDIDNERERSPYRNVSPTSNPTNPRDVSASSVKSDQSSSSVALVDPHQLISEKPLEWGTAEQYNLLKLPLIRVNRLRDAKSKSLASCGRRRGRHKNN